VRADGIINPGLAAALARLRHTDTVVVADAGLPVPDGPLLVDVAVVYGLPRFADVLAAVVGELVVDAVIAANEVVDGNPAMWRLLSAMRPRPDLVAHEELKRRVADSLLVIRTGENTPYANVILRCGVPF
jgi:D-ribose pyranase